MRRGNIFWGVLLVILGSLFLLQRSGLISDVFGWFWAIFLIFLGVWVLTRRMIPQDAPGQEEFSVALQDETKELTLDLDHGAGSVQLTGGAAVGVAVSGFRAPGMELKHRQAGDRLEVDIDAGPSVIPFLGPDTGVWRFLVTGQIPLTLDVDAGATQLDFDLSDLKVTRIKVDMGASSLKVRLPISAGYTRMDVDSGAATIDINVPQGVALRLSLNQSASSLDVDQGRFSMQDNHLYQSVDYETAANKVEISLNGGANAVKVW